jgi:hypothetical protein
MDTEDDGIKKSGNISPIIVRRNVLIYKYAIGPGHILGLLTYYYYCYTIICPIIIINVIILQVIDYA